MGYDGPMGRRFLAAMLILGGCKASIGDGAGDGSVTDAIDAPGTPIDAAPDALVLGAWGAPAKVPGASTATLQEDDGSLSSTTLEMVFAVVNANDANRKDLYVQTRPSPAGTWTAPTKLPFSLTGSSEETPRFSSDDLTLYFASDRAGGAGGLDIYMVTRTSTASPWGPATRVAAASSAVSEKWFAPCAGSRYLVIVGTDIAEGTLGAGPPTVVAELSSPQNETGAFITRDCLTTYFASARSGTVKLYTSTRTTVGGTWPAPTEVTDFAQLGGAQEDPWLAPDNRTFALVSDIGGTKDVYLSTR